ncbi:hypothetical protein ACFL0D_07200, partial [Thermoproteota archaeon]
IFIRHNNLDILAETRREIYDKAKIKEAENYRKQVEIEQAELPSLIDRCVDWTQAKGISRLAKADIKSFLFECDIKITTEIENQLYSRANTKLKSKY